MIYVINELLVMNRANEWLKERGRERKDVMWSEKGRYHYVLVDSEDGYEEVKLPEEFDIAFF